MTKEAFKLTEDEIAHVLGDNHKAEPKPAEADVTIRLPDRWTVAMYECYIEGRQKYIEKRRAEKFASVPEWITMFHGALALIKAQYVKIDGLDRLMKAVEDEGLSDMAVIGFIARSIAGPIEASVNGPLAGWTVKS